MTSTQRFRRLAVGGLAAVVGGAGLFSWYAGQQLTQRPEPDAYANPARYDLPFEQVSFASRNDSVTLRGWFIPVDGARGTIIFCPGYFGSMHSDLDYAPWFHDAGYELLMFDWRGRGRSDSAVGSFGILERRDLLGAIDFLKERGIDQVGLMGFSMGGAVAMTTSALSDAVVAVVADGVFARVVDSVANGMVQQHGMPSAIANALSRPIVWAASLQLGVDITLIDPIRWAAFFHAPLLVIHGRRDPYVPLDAVYRLYHKAREPKELWMVPEAGHREVYQLRETEYRERVIGFFGEWLRA